MIMKSLADVRLAVCACARGLACGRGKDLRHFLMFLEHGKVRKYINSGASFLMFLLVGPWIGVESVMLAVSDGIN